MKINKALQVVSVALPTLASMPAGATWLEGSTTFQGTGYSASYNLSTSATVATYSNGVTTETITYYNIGDTLPSGTKVTTSHGSAIASYWQESDIWDEGCFCFGQSEIDKVGDKSNNSAMAQIDDGCL